MIRFFNFDHERIMAQTLWSRKMDIILYSPKADGIEKKLWHDLEGLDQEAGPELHRSIISLEYRLKQPRQGIGALLAYVPDRAGLIVLLVLRDLLFDLPLVVLLKEPDVETITAAHALRPRVILETPLHIREVMPVLEKIVARWKRRNTKDNITKERKVAK